MGYSGTPAKVIKNNRNLLRNVSGFKSNKRTKRIFKEKEVNPNIKKMSKNEIKKLRKELELSAKRKKQTYWVVFLVIFFSLFAYLLLIN